VACARNSSERKSLGGLKPGRQMIITIDVKKQTDGRYLSIATSEVGRWQVRGYGDTPAKSAERAMAIAETSVPPDRWDEDFILSESSKISR